MDKDDDEFENRVQFVTLGFKGRRNLLSSDLAKRIVLGVIYNAMRKFDVPCVGYVIMPNHVHAIFYFLSRAVRRGFMRYWKRRCTIEIRKAAKSKRIKYPLKYFKNNNAWIHRCHSFTIKTRKKLEEKLNYMHMNPVRAGLVERAIDWPWSSARYYELGKSVGIPITWIDLD